MWSCKLFDINVFYYKYSLPDGIPCVLGNNADGYIPIRFDHSMTLHIQGRRVIEDQARLNKRINSMIVPPTTKQSMNEVTNEVKPISIHDLVSPSYLSHTMPPENYVIEQNDSPSSRPDRLVWG